MAKLTVAQLTACLHGCYHVQRDAEAALAGELTLQERRNVLQTIADNDQHLSEIKDQLRAITQGGRQ